MIDLVPLKLFSQRIAEGWRMCPGYPLEPGDFAVTMQSPDHESEIAKAKERRRERDRARASKGAPPVRIRAAGDNEDNRRARW